MKTSQEILKLLTQNQGSYLSGEALAARLCISRTAVWKAVQQLKDEGHIITAATNKGYVLENDSNVLTDAAIIKYLKSNRYHIDVRDSVSSTNTVMKAMAEQGAPEYSVLISACQTDGRGRMGRSFHSPSQSGIYMSILFRPKLSAQASLHMTTCAAVACANALEKLSGKNALIKWVNDIYIDERKVCGILTEASVDFESGGLSYAVLGIGVNVTAPQNGFPDDIKNRAGSLFNAECKNKNLRAQTAAEILDTIALYYDFNGEMPVDKSIILDEYRKRSLVTGKEIEILHHDCTRLATAVGIDDEFRLIARLADGQEEHLSSGDIRIIYHAEQL